MSDGTADRLIYGRLAELYRQQGDDTNERRVIDRALRALDPARVPAVGAEEKQPMTGTMHRRPALMVR